MCRAGARRWQEAHTLQLCMKKCKQASSSGQGGDLQELPGIPGHWVHSEGREGVIYSGDSCWWNWTRHMYEKIVLEFSLRIIYVTIRPCRVKTNLQYLCNFHDFPALGRLVCSWSMYFFSDDVFLFRKTSQICEKIQSQACRVVVEKSLWYYDIALT